MTTNMNSNNNNNKGRVFNKKRDTYILMRTYNMIYLYNTGFPSRI